MFENDPPPLPSVPCIETSSNSNFADLSDYNRITAVADNDYNGNDDTEFRLHMSILLGTGSNSELVNPEMATSRTGSTEASESPECFQNFVMKTSSCSDSDDDSRFLFSHHSKSEDSLEDSHDIKYCVTALSVQENKTASDGSHDMIASSKERKDSIPPESAEDEIKDGSGLHHIDLTVGNGKEIIVQNALQNDEDDDEFGDFEEFVKAEEDQKSENASWADFESSSLPHPDINKSAVTSSGAEVQSSSKISLLPTLLESFCDDQLWATFAEEGEKSDERDVLANGVYETLNDAVNKKDTNRPDKMIWLAVSIIEEALALKLQWHDSLIRSYFLNSLDIDVNQTTIRNSDLPIFAQQLEESAVLAPVSVVESSFGAVDEKNPSSISHQAIIQPPECVTIDSLAVPPVHFDWNTSGLTNPLKTGSLNVSSAPLDLDFLVSTSSRDSVVDGSSSMQVFSTLQKDLTAFGLNLPDDAGKKKSGKDVSGNTAHVLNCILNKNGNERKCKPVSELSLDARALHDQLPDLDYMLSNVLLFPVVDR